MDTIIKTCSVEGCGGKYFCRTLCAKHYRSLFFYGGKNNEKYPKCQNTYTIEGDYVLMYLKRGKVCIFDKMDLQGVKKYVWNLTTGDHYVSCNKDRKTLLMHRLIMGFPKEIDHINGNGLDNRRKNLRIVTRMQNTWNMKKTHGSGRFIGVCFCKRRNKWIARAMIRAKHYYLGAFSSEIDAARVRDKWVKENKGEYGRLNFRHE